MLSDILLKVNKPARYIGGEWNVAKKDFGKAEVKFALCFPDLYEIGMSNLGLRIIYSILNSLDYAVCERFFSPSADMEALLRSGGGEILSLETAKRLREFDIVGFSLAYELSYTNALNILDLGGIPLQSDRRQASMPLVIGGGPSTLNPEPLHEFFDLFIIGEAEEAIVELSERYRKAKAGFRAARTDKRELLVSFSDIEGVYAPSLYEARYDGRGAVEEFKPAIPGLPAKVRKRFVSNLDEAHFPVEWLVPYIQIVHDRISLEVMRGCPNRCRFCQARSQYFPLRHRSRENILGLAEVLYRNTGYEEISLCGLSVSDYPKIEGLFSDLNGLFKGDNVGISLPSIKPKGIVADVSAAMAAVKKSGLTFAPEAASQRLRGILAKDFDVEGLFDCLAKAFCSGWQRVKLYFMIGLPTEDDRDLDAIIDFARSVSELKKSAIAGLSVLSPGQKPSAASVNISVNTFIPKPHTPLQWLGMERLEDIERKQAYLKGRTRSRRLELNLHNPRMSLLEAVFSRGDRRLSKVILAAFRNGARFDAWDDHFRFDAWIAGFRETGIDPEAYLRQRQLCECLPWDFLDLGIGKDALAAEFKKAIAI